MSLTVAVLAVLVIAFLYSSVGHAGASGYIATLTLLGFASTIVRPTALLLNILVAILGTIQFYRAGHFRWSLFWPFALLSIPGAFLGGALHVPRSVLNPILAVVLMFSAVRLLMRKRDPDVVTPPGKPASIAMGAGIGFLSGITGTGGGIFLTPLLLFFRWSRTRTAAAVSVVFILVNSTAGLGGYVWSGQAFPPVAWPLGAAALIGGATGSYLGSTRLPLRTIYIMLATVLSIASVKLLLT